MHGQTLASELLENSDFDSNYRNCQFWKGQIPKIQMLNLFSWPHLNRALATSRITNDRLRLSVKDGYEQPNSQAFRKVRDAFGRPTDSLSISELHRLMAQGVTGVLEAANELFPDIAAFTEVLGARYYARSTANAYFSFGSTSGFGAHNDDHDVIVMQIEGRKSWRFFGTMDKPSMATVDDLKQPREENLSEILVLNEGDVLFVPKGTWHDVVAINEPSLHLTISIVYPTVADYAKWLLDQHKYELPYRDIKLIEDVLDSVVKGSADFFAAAINKESIATFLDSYYARHAASRIQPSFPHLNRPQAGDFFRRVPFTVTEVKLIDDSSGEHVILALGKKHTLSRCEFGVFNNLYHDRSVSLDDLLRLADANTNWSDINVAIETLLDYGLLSKSIQASTLQ